MTLVPMAMVNHATGTNVWFHSFHSPRFCHHVVCKEGLYLNVRYCEDGCLPSLPPKQMDGSAEHHWTWSLLFCVRSLVLKRRLSYHCLAIRGHRLPFLEDSDRYPPRTPVAPRETLDTCFRVPRNHLIRKESGFGGKTLR